jgi:hypothetical protein
MNRLFFNILPILLCLTIQSCCTKKYCTGFDDLNEIQLINFESSEVDSISIEIYVDGSNFSNRIDSVFTQAKAKGTSEKELFIFMPEKLNRNHAYKITLFANSTVYLFSDFEVRKEECNCPNDKYNVLDSYKLNGKLNISSAISIVK